ncbi:hypothetical protein SORBI_3004G215650 [Sorghum bicolor]|uniref:Uncharacterized protein n=1 Tax=Sorghum bicolor TaxID=4558 RepID=A0A1Z5RNN5_SORBI|nr:hypothetical protein SORBI_3004G215650 [Sorghum bicolor]
MNRVSAPTEPCTLAARRIQLRAPTKIPSLLKNFSLGVNRKGQDGPRSDGKHEVSCNMASKVKHLAWHPAEKLHSLCRQ